MTNEISIHQIPTDSLDLLKLMIQHSQDSILDIKFMLC
jgi:hypothetical protein